MDFDDTREEAAFRAEARAFLAANAQEKRGAFETWQSRYPGRDGFEGLERAKEFQAKKADAGFAALHWPAEFGGRALPPIYQVIYQQEFIRQSLQRAFQQGARNPTILLGLVEAGVGAVTLDSTLSLADLSAIALQFRSFDPEVPADAPADDLDVPDPYGGGEDGFVEVLEIVERTSRQIVRELEELLG